MDTLTDHEKDVMFINELTLVDYDNRRRNGWSHEEAIYIRKDVRRESVYKGDYPLTKDELVSIYQNGITLDTYRMRRAIGWRHMDAMTIPKRKKRLTNIS